MDEINETGGARVGWARATWPFATLTVSKDKLELNASIIGGLAFKPLDIISITPASTFSFISKGIKITHNVKNYSQNVVFMTTGSPNELIWRIEQIGFLNNQGYVAPHILDEIATKQNSGSFPIKIPALIGIAVIWNLFYLLDYLKVFSASKVITPLGVGAELALGFMVILCLLLLFSNAVRKLILKPGRELKDVSAFIYFILFVTGVGLMMLTLDYFVLH